MPLWIDVHADIGDWAFRRVTGSTPEALTAKMREYQGAVALVGPVEGVLYRNPQEAARLLRERLDAAGHPPWLVPVAVINPAYPGWKKDLDEAQSHGAAAIKLYPNYHNYNADGVAARDLASSAAGLGLPLLCCVRVEDERQHHWHMLRPAVPASAVARLAQLVPTARIILVGANQAEIQAFLAATEKGCTWAEVSYLKSPQNAMETMVAAVGASRLLFGSHTPFIDPGVTLTKIERSALSQEDKNRVLRSNALGVWPQLSGLAGPASLPG